MIKLRFFREIIYKIRKRINFTNFFISELNNTILLNIDFFPLTLKKNREINQQYAAASLISQNFFRQMKAFRIFFRETRFRNFFVNSHLMWIFNVKQFHVISIFSFPNSLLNFSKTVQIHFPEYLTKRVKFHNYHILDNQYFIEKWFHNLFALSEL